MKGRQTYIEEQGVVIVRGQDKGVLAADIYKGDSQGTQVWQDWVDAIRTKDRDGSKGLTASLYALPDISVYKGKTDRQIAFLLQDVKPEQTVKALEAEYASRNGVSPYNDNSIQRLISREPERFRQFQNYMHPLLGTLNRMMTDNEELIGQCHVQRVFELKDYYSFTGGDSIRDGNDVAWIFRQLGNKAIENCFCLLQKGDESFILHVGMGGLAYCPADQTAIITAAERFQAEKVWFIHNHPSGRVYASVEDKRLWNDLHSALGDRLQDGIIINTDSGIYGVYNNHYADTVILDGNGKNRGRWQSETQIPLLTFDRKVFNDAYKSYAGTVISDSTAVAEFLSTQRFGERSRYGILALDRAMAVCGNFHLPDNRWTNGKVAADYITKACMSVGAAAAVVYGTVGGGYKDQVEVPKDLGEKIKVASCNSLRLMDVVEMGVDDRQGWMRSYNDEGLLFEPAVQYRKEYDSIDIIPIKDGRGMIRVVRGGERQPAEIIRAKDMKLYSEGGLTARQLADTYCKVDRTTGGRQD